MPGDQFQVLHSAIPADYDVQSHGSLNSIFTGFLRIRGIHFVFEDFYGDVTTHSHTGRYWFGRRLILRGRRRCLGRLLCANGQRKGKCNE